VQVSKLSAGIAGKSTGKALEFSNKENGPKRFPNASIESLIMRAFKEGLAHFGNQPEILVLMRTR